MRLYLSSMRMGDEFQSLLDMVGPGARAAVISNAVDYIPPPLRRAYECAVFDPVSHFRRHGVSAQALDLRRFFGRPDDLETTLAGVDLVWSVGGNAFLLMRALRRSGCDRILTRRLAEDSLVYGGWSAGAVVAGPSLRGMELMDDPAVLANGYDAEPVWDGLGLVDFTVVPHFESRHVDAPAARRVAAHFTAQGVAHRTLRDGEVIVWNGAERH